MVQGDGSSVGSSGELEDTQQKEKFQQKLHTLTEEESGDEDHDVEDPEGAQTLKDAEFRERKKNACIWSAPNPQIVRHGPLHLPP